MTRKMPYRRYEELKSLAADLIEDYSLSYPLDPFEIAATLGVHVTVHQSGLPNAARFCGTTDGYTTPAQSAHGVKFKVHLNGATSRLRRRFTLMHEIAHIWLDHPRAGETWCENVAEAEANFLAGYLLAPDALVLDWVQDLTVAGIAREFQVSDAAAGIIHHRVLRMLNGNNGRRCYDRRIASSAVRLLDKTASGPAHVQGLA
ncbi:MAG: ImmA/IrrE family metallo-endopeptidase [Actinomycetota bacterium]